MITDQAFAGLAFPAIRVKYLGPTNHRGARWAAAMAHPGGVSRLTVPYDDAINAGAQNAVRAARKLWEQYRTTGDDDVVLIPGDLDADSYVFLVVNAITLDRIIAREAT